MNMRLFAVLGVVACAAVTGCVVVGNTPDGTGGNGGNSSSSAGVGGAGGAGGSGQGGAGQGGQGGTGGSACTTCCGDFVSGLSDTLCAGSAGETTYNALADCTCVTGCQAECGDNLCKQLMATDVCMNCIQNGACKDAFGTCSADVCP